MIEAMSDLIAWTKCETHPRAIYFRNTGAADSIRSVPTRGRNRATYDPTSKVIARLLELASSSRHPGTPGDADELPCQISCLVRCKEEGKVRYVMWPPEPLNRLVHTIRCIRLAARFLQHF